MALSRTGTLRHLSLGSARTLQQPAESPPFCALSHDLCPTGTSSTATRLYASDRGDRCTHRRRLCGSAVDPGDDSGDGPGLWFVETTGDGRATRTCRRERSTPNPRP